MNEASNTRTSREKANRNADHMTAKLYQMLGDYGALRNMLTARSEKEWRFIATAFDRDYIQRKIKHDLRRTFLEQVFEHLPIKTTENPQTQIDQMFGFVFSEDELLGLLHKVYLQGMSDGRPPFIVGEP